jgi:hypothetical protein
MTVRSGARGGSHRTRLRTCIAWCAFVALAWPSLGPLPWVVTQSLPHPHAAQAPDAVGSDAQEHRHVDVSAIPGTPTHPADHDCAECQVLKHLARCIPCVPAIDVSVPRAAAVVAPPLVVEHRTTSRHSLLPPVRAPPAIVV